MPVDDETPIDTDDGTDGDDQEASTLPMTLTGRVVLKP